MQKIISGFQIDKICKKNAYVECVDECNYAWIYDVCKIITYISFLLSKIWKTPGIHKREIK